VGCVPPNHHIQVKTFPFFNADNKWMHEFVLQGLCNYLCV
jgi:hypothetical protein